MSSKRQSAHNNFSQPESDQTADLLNMETISIYDGLRALLHQCLATNEDYTTLDNAVTKLEDEIEHCETNDAPSTMPSGAEDLKASVSRHSASSKHGTAKVKLHHAQEERDAMLQRVYNEEVLPVVIGGANDDNIRQCLEDFRAILEEPNPGSDSPDSNLQESYINLCHAALDHFRHVELASLASSNSSLDVRFMRNPNRQLVSLPVCTSRERRTKRRPDIICTSRRAQQALTAEKESKDERETQMPTVAWPHVLQCVEVKRTSSTTRQGPERSKRFNEGPFQMTDPCPWVAEHRALKQNPGGSDKTRGSSLSSTSVSTLAKDSSWEAQSGACALTMLSQSQGVKHTINILITDQWASMMFVNRQNVFLTSPFDILNEFPYFLAMLFLVQRFTLKNWGVIPTLNPAAVAALEGKTDRPGCITLDLQTDCDDPWPNNPPSPLVIEPTYLNNEPRTLLGRATGVRPARFEPAANERLVCKVYNPEVARHHEGKILVALHAIASKADPTMHQHLPTLKAYADIADTDTRWLASLFRRKIEGHRITRIIVLEDLWPAQATLKRKKNAQGETVGDEQGRTFIKAWLDVVKCHAFLWENLVEHGGPGLDNFMFNPRLKCGVLIGFDLSVFRWGPRRVPGIDGTGTIPFMAIRLLCEEYWAGKIIRRYFDELEALCWILPYVWLGGTKADSPIDCWKTHDYNACVKEKTRFLSRSTRWDDEYEPEDTRRFVQYTVHGVLVRASMRRQLIDEDMFFSQAGRQGQEIAAFTAIPEQYPGHDNEVLGLFLGVLGYYEGPDPTSLVPSGYAANFPRPTFTKPTAEEANRIIGIVGTDLFV